MKWEYMLIEFHGDTAKEIEDRMDLRGSEGWELVAVSEGVAYMKRRGCLTTTDEDEDKE